MKLDQTNRRILQVLQKDGSITNAELARQIGLAPATTLERVRKMEQSGVIARYAAVVDRGKGGAAHNGLCGNRHFRPFRSSGQGV